MEESAGMFKAWVVDMCASRGCGFAGEGHGRGVGREVVGEGGVASERCTSVDT